MSGGQWATPHFPTWSIIPAGGNPVAYVPMAAWPFVPCQANAQKHFA